MALAPASTKPQTLITFINRWCYLLGVIRIILPDVAGSKEMLTWLHHVLTQVHGNHAHLYAHVHEKLQTWRQLLVGLAHRPTNLRELLKYQPTWSGATEASGTGMGNVCRNPSVQWFFWKASFPTTNHKRLVSFENPTGYIAIKNLKLCALLMQLALFCTYMPPLSRILTQVDNTTV